MSPEVQYVIFKEFPNGVIRQANVKPLNTIVEAEKIAEELSTQTGMPHYWMEMPPEKQTLYPNRSETPQN